jgi:hypothetical protein
MGLTRAERRERELAAAIAALAREPAEGDPHRLRLGNRAGQLAREWVCRERDDLAWDMYQDVCALKRAQPAEFRAAIDAVLEALRPYLDPGA